MDKYILLRVFARNFEDADASFTTAWEVSAVRERSAPGSIVTTPELDWYRYVALALVYKLIGLRARLEGYVRWVALQQTKLAHRLRRVTSENFFGAEKAMLVRELLMRLLKKM